MRRDGEIEVGCGLFVLVFLAISLAGWCTHVIVCIQRHEWFLLIAGAVAAPVGVFHGWGLWFGWWS